MTIHKNLSTELRSFKVAAGAPFDMLQGGELIEFFVTIDGTTAKTAVLFSEALDAGAFQPTPLDRVVFNQNDLASGAVVINPLANTFDTTVLANGGQINVGLYQSAQHNKVKCSVDVVYHCFGYVDEKR